MKALHRPDLFSWSRFDEARDVDFNSVAWVGPDGNVLIDPLELSPHDEAHLRELGGAAWIVLTNSDHIRSAAKVQSLFNAKLAGPFAERSTFPLACERWLSQGDELVPGLHTHELNGSKTAGELALVLEQTTLITGDLIRGQRAGSLNLLPDAKLKDKSAVIASVRALLELKRLDTVLVGDGWPVFREGYARLRELVL